MGIRLDDLWLAIPMYLVGLYIPMYLGAKIMGY